MPDGFEHLHGMKREPYRPAIGLDEFTPPYRTVATATASAMGFTFALMSIMFACLGDGPKR